MHVPETIEGAKENGTNHVLIEMEEIKYLLNIRTDCNKQN